MKIKFLLSLLVFTTLFNLLNAQEKLDGVFPLKNGLVTYTGVVEVEDAKADELFDKAVEWVNLAFESDKPIILYLNRDKGRVIAEGFFKETWELSVFGDEKVEFWQKVVIDVKDGKYRYSLSNFRLRLQLVNSDKNFQRDLNYDIESWTFERSSRRTRFFEKLANGVEERIGKLEETMKTPLDNW